MPPRRSCSSGFVARVEELTKLGLMRPTGIAAFEARDQAGTAIYAYERPLQEFGEALLREFQGNAPAWAFFEAQPAAGSGSSCRRRGPRGPHHASASPGVNI